MAFTHEQKLVITHNKKHAKVSAVAGSGKTATMVARVIYLLLNGVKEENILILMFNDKAKTEFRQRLENQCKAYNLTAPEVKTFHSFGFQLLKKLNELEFIPFKRLSVKPWESENLAKLALSNQSKKQFGFLNKINKEKVEDFIDFIDIVKSDIVSSREKFIELKYSNDNDIFINAFYLFEKERKKKNMHFFNDLIFDPVKFLLKNPDKASLFNNQYEHIIIDEYQDINECQQQMVKLISNNNTKIMVVGDGDQCIYDWRGAKPEYIINKFKEEFIEVDDYFLSNTFRNGHAISLIANSVIKHNINRNDQTCISYKDAPETNVFNYAENDFTNRYSSIVNDWLNKGNKISDCAILCRLHNMSIPVELDLLKNNIPYEIIDRESILLRNDIQGIINLIKISKRIPLNDENDIKNIFFLLGINFKYESINSLISNILSNPLSSSFYFKESANYFSGYLKNILLEKSQFWKDFLDFSKNKSSHEIINFIFKKLNLDSLYEKLHAKQIQVEQKIKTIITLSNIAKEIEESGSCFLEYIDDCIKNINKKSSEKVSIMTIHKSKGMEFPCVIIPGLKEGDFPFYKEPTPLIDVESERRLFYVAITRAEKELHLIHPHDHFLDENILRMSTNTNNIEKDKASRFLFESNILLAQKLSKMIYQNETNNTIKAENGLYAIKYLEEIKSNIKVVSILNETEINKLNKPSGFEINDKVEHPIFGEGTVKELSFKDKSTISIYFEKEKRDIVFLLKNANIKKILN